MSAFPLLDWCREATRKETPNREVETGWWSRVAPTVVPSLRERRHDSIALAELVTLLRDPFLQERFRFLTRGFHGEPTLRVYRGLLALVIGAWSEGSSSESESLFATASGREGDGDEPDPTFGAWAYATWRHELGAVSGHEEPPGFGARVVASLVSTSGTSARLSAFKVQAVDAPWEGIRPHPFSATALVFKSDFAASIAEAWVAAGERHPGSSVRSAVWWIDGPARETPLDGDSHGGMLAAAFSALSAGVASDREFLATCGLDEDRIGLHRVGGVRIKARAALTPDPVTGRARISRFFVHPADFAEAVEGAADVGVGASAVVSGSTLDELLLQSESAFGLPRRFARAEAIRVLGVDPVGTVPSRSGRTNEAQLRRAVERAIGAWVPLALKSVGDVEILEGRADDLVDEQRRLIIEGDPGSGKSLLLQRLVARGHASFRPDADGTVARPEESRAVALVRAVDLIRLEMERAEENVSGDFLGAIAALLGSRNDLPSEEIRTALERGRITLAIDGLEDVGFTDASELSKRLGSLATTSPEFRFVATARSQTEGAVGFTQSGAPRFRLGTFGAREVGHAVTLFTEANPELRDAVERAASAAQLHEFATSPLLVRLFVDAVAVSSNVVLAGITPSRHAIYEKYVTARLATLPIRSMARVRILESLRTYAGILAYNLFEEGVRDGHSEAEYHQAQLSCDRQYHAAFERSLTGDLIHAGLLKIDRTDGVVYRFFHVSIGEFLAAKRLAAEFDREDGRRSRIVSELAHAANWRPTLEFLAGHSRDPLRYVEALVVEAERDPLPTTLLLVSNILRVMCAQPV